MPPTTGPLDDLRRELSVLPGHAEHSSHAVWEPINLYPIVTGTAVVEPPSLLTRDDGVPLLYAGRINAFVGEPESLKTFLALLAVAQEITAGHHVVYNDFEDAPVSAVERLVALGATNEDILDFFSYYEGVPPQLSDADQQEMLQLIEDQGPVTLAVFDGVTEAMAALGLDPNQGSDVVEFYRGAPRWFAEQGAAVLLLDHVVKDRTGRGRWAIGSERKLSGIDGAAYVLQAITPFGRGRSGQVKITVAKDRPGHVRQHEGQGRVIAVFQPQSQPNGKISSYLVPPEPSSEGGGFRPTVYMERVSRTLENATEPLTGRQVREQTRGKAEYIANALTRLVEEGYVKADPGPRNGTYYSLLKPFRAHAGTTNDNVPEDADDDLAPDLDLDCEDDDPALAPPMSPALVLPGSPLKGWEPGTRKPTGSWNHREQVRNRSGSKNTSINLSSTNPPLVGSAPARPPHRPLARGAKEESLPRDTKSAYSQSDHRPPDPPPLRGQPTNQAFPRKNSPKRPTAGAGNQATKHTPLPNKRSQESSHPINLARLRSGRPRAS